MKFARLLLPAFFLAAVVSGTARATQYSISITPPAASDEVSDGATSLYELGTRFSTDVDGQILAIRYWQPALETGSHVGTLWSTDGTSGTFLESVSFSNETHGWMQATLATPVNITAGQIYVVSVNSNVYYAATHNGLAASLVDGPIHTVVGNNGVYNTTPGSFPNNSYQSSNYYRDVVFQPTAVPEPAALSTLALGGLLLLRRRPHK